MIVFYLNDFEIDRCEPNAFVAKLSDIIQPYIDFACDIQPCHEYEPESGFTRIGYQATWLPCYGGGIDKITCRFERSQ